MPRTLRHRAAGAAVLVTGVLVTAAGPALAGPEGGAEVTFRGNGNLLGLPVLSCTSAPDTDRLSVPAETTVRFVNHTGQQATLRVDGQDAGTVGANEAVPVVFHRGQVSVTMTPECALNVNRSNGSVTIEVVAAPAAASAGGIRSQEPAGGGSAGPGTGGAAPVPAPESPDNADFPLGTGTIALPSTATENAGEASALSRVGDPAAVAAGKVAVAAPVPVPPAPVGANSLLALIATVFVVGVSAGAIRAILSQRASRAVVA